MPKQRELSAQSLYTIDSLVGVHDVIRLGTK